MSAVVLIVEDNPRNLKLVRDVLGHAGFSTLEAADGETGIALARSRRPDLILMDVHLPGIDGVEALARLRADPATAGIPVAALTAYAMKDDRARLEAVGFDGYLEKPVSVRELPRQVEALIPAVILAVDDLPQNVRLLRAVLEPRGFAVAGAASGEEALARLAAGGVDLVLLDVVMPGINGYEICRRVREDPATAFLPVVMITASGEQEKRRAIEAGADDFVTKPFESAELLARVRSLLRVKRYHDEIEAYNRGLRRFLPPQVAELVKGDPSVLESHRREIAVLSCALHGFPAFAEGAEPEDVMAVLDAYHAALGELVHAAEGTLARLTGDGLLVVFNDPLPCEDPAGRAVRLALSMRDGVWELAERWARLGFSLQLAAGIALGHATIGRIGFERRWEYAPVGRTPMLAERLCESAGAGQVLVDQRVFAAVAGFAITQVVGEVALRGFARPARVYDVVGLEG